MEASRDLGIEAQKVAEAHLAACQEVLWAEEEDREPLPDSPAYAPFCGCETCVVREVLWSVSDLLVEMTREPLLKIAELGPLSMFEAKRIAREWLVSMGEDLEIPRTPLHLAGEALLSSVGSEAEGHAGGNGHVRPASLEEPPLSPPLEAVGTPAVASRIRELELALAAERRRADALEEQLVLREE